MNYTAAAIYQVQSSPPTHLFPGSPAALTTNSHAAALTSALWLARSRTMEGVSSSRVADLASSRAGTFLRALKRAGTRSGGTGAKEEVMTETGSGEEDGGGSRKEEEEEGAEVGEVTLLAMEESREDMIIVKAGRRTETADS